MSVSLSLFRIYMLGFRLIGLGLAVEPLRFNALPRSLDLKPEPKRQNRETASAHSGAPSPHLSINMKHVMEASTRVLGSYKIGVQGLGFDWLLV